MTLEGDAHALRVRGFRPHFFWPLRAAEDAAVLAAAVAREYRDARCEATRRRPLCARFCGARGADGKMAVLFSVKENNYKQGCYRIKALQCNDGIVVLASREHFSRIWKNLYS